MFRSLIQCMSRAYAVVVEALRWQRDVIFAKSEPDRYAVDFDEHKATFTWNGWPQCSMAWADMRDCIIYQTDQVIYEVIHLKFGDAGNVRFNCHDMSDGFSAFIDAANRRFPGFEKHVSEFTKRGIGKGQSIEPVGMTLAIGEAPNIVPIERVLKP